MKHEILLWVAIVASLAGCGEDPNDLSGTLGAGRADAASENVDAGVSAAPVSSDAAVNRVDGSPAVGATCPPLSDFASSGGNALATLCAQRNAEPDAGVGLVCTDLEPMQGESDLIIAQVHLEFDAVEFFNPTDEPIGLDGYVLSQPPHCVTIDGTGIAVAPHAYALLENLGPIEFGTGRPGEISLFSRPKVDDRSAMLDFVCWNGDSAESHRSVAETTQDGVRLWYDECPTPANGILQRVHFSHGFFGEDYWTDDWVVWTCPVCP